MIADNFTSITTGADDGFHLKWGASYSIASFDKSGTGAPLLNLSALGEIGFSNDNLSISTIDTKFTRQAEAEILANGKVIQTDLVSGYKLTPDLTALTADRGFTYPNFDFDFNDWFDSSRNFSLNSTIDFDNSISIANTSSRNFDVRTVLSGSPKVLFRVSSTTRIQLTVGQQIAWGSGYADSSRDVGIVRDSAGVLKVTDGSTGTGDLLYHKPLINISALHTAVATNHIINCTANSFTVTLPTAVGIQGKEYTVKNSGSGVITVDGDGTETIDDDLTQSLNQYDSLTIVSDNTNWIIL